MRSESANEVRKAIEGKPHYRVILRPAGFEQQRIKSVHEVERIVRETSVSRRGWDFPFLSSRPEEWERAASFVSSWVLFPPHAEIWRLFVSGQFVYAGAIRESDPEYQQTIRQHTFCRGEDAMHFDLGNVLWCFTEFWEFASRLAQKLDLVEGIDFSVEVLGIKEWRLGTSSLDRVFTESAPCYSENIRLEQRYRYADLLMHRSCSLAAFEQFLTHFDKQLDTKLLEQMQQELFELSVGRDNRTKSS